MTTGKKIRLKGRGRPAGWAVHPATSSSRSPSADHHLFGRAGNDLTLEVPITFAEATLGADISVPTLDAGPVKMRIPPGTSSGKTFRLRGKGGSGDLLGHCRRRRARGALGRTEGGGRGVRRRK